MADYFIAGSGKTVLSYVLTKLFVGCAFTSFISSSIIEEVHDMRQMGLVTISMFYFDFRDRGKQNIRHLLSSILVQLCGFSEDFSEILSTLFKDYGSGSRQPGEDVLIECLRRMLRLQGQGAHYLVHQQKGTFLANVLMSTYRTCSPLQAICK